jgi:steroid delta-isomerase-like uncharacterized protein
MSTEENKAIFVGFREEFWNRGNVNVVNEFMTPDFVSHEEEVPGVPLDRESLIRRGATMHSAFPDLKATLEDMIAEGDRVVARSTWSGTHTGELMGLPPTGRRVSVGVIDIVRIAGGKIVEHWGEMDSMGLMQQLGVIPAPQAGQR